MSEGYVLVALGAKYHQMVKNFVSTLRKYGDKRPVFIINEENLNSNTNLFRDCSSAFERYGTYPKITLDEYLPFDHNMYLDCDMLCGANTDHVWEYFKSSDNYVHQLGKYPSLWKPEFKDNFENMYSKKLYLCHGSLIYMRRGKEFTDFSSFMKDDVWNNYFKYNFNDINNHNSSRSGKTDQVIYSIASALMDIFPSDMMGHPFVTHVSGPRTFNGVGQRNVYFRDEISTFNIDVPFFHMWDKVDSPNYINTLKALLL